MNGEAVPVVVPDNFSEYKQLNPELFPEGTSEEQQHKIYSATLQVKKTVKKCKVASGTVNAPAPHREWKITINDMRLQDQTETALDALADINDPPFLFHRSRGLVRIGYDEKGMPLIEPLNEAALRGIIERCCQFQYLNKKGEEKPISPPKDVIQDIATLPYWNSIYPLAGIIECPYISRDNCLTTDQGYSQATRLYYAPPPGFISPSIPDNPKEADIKNSIELLEEIYHDFPFLDKASRTNTIATLICSILRPMIDGPVPMALINKPQAGVGASKIAETIAIAATGRPASMMTAPSSESEWRKKITSTLQNGRSIAIIDNIENQLYAPSLAALLTANMWEDRLLGISKNVSLPHRMQWIGTGNNILLGGDLPRRCYMVNLRSDSARPWQRDESRFKHSQLLEWVSANRSRIIAAVLTLARAWIRAGRPDPGKSIPKTGGFEEWRFIVGGIVVKAGLPDFLGNLEEMYQQSDFDGPQWEIFFERWYQKYGDTSTTVAAIVKDLKDHENAAQQTFTDPLSLLDVLPDSLLEAWNGKKSFARVFGNRLAKMNGRIFVNGCKLVKSDVAHSAVSWKVEMTEPEKGELVK